MSSNVDRQLSEPKSCETLKNQNDILNVYHNFTIKTLHEPKVYHEPLNFWLPLNTVHVAFLHYTRQLWEKFASKPESTSLPHIPKVIRKGGGVSLTLAKCFAMLAKHILGECKTGYRQAFYFLCCLTHIVTQSGLSYDDSFPFRILTSRLIALEKRILHHEIFAGSFRVQQIENAHC